MSTENTMVNTSLCYVRQNGCYLMLHRIKKEHDINKDKWIGIGGKFETAESPEDCMLREAQEETGLTITDWTYHGIVTFVTETGFTEFMHLFSSDSFTGSLRECDEGVLEWVAQNRVAELDLWEGDLIFLRLMENGAPFFSLKLVYDGNMLMHAVLNGKELHRKDYGVWN